MNNFSKIEKKFFPIFSSKNRMVLVHCSTGRLFIHDTCLTVTPTLSEACRHLHRGPPIIHWIRQERISSSATFVKSPSNWSHPCRDTIRWVLWILWLPDICNVSSFLFEMLCSIFQTFEVGRVQSVLVKERKHLNNIFSKEEGETW